MKYLGNMKFKQWDCEIWETSYTNNNRMAIILETPDGAPVATATVNLPDDKLKKGEVFIRDTEENEGMLSALIEAGILEDTGRRVQSGWISIPVAKLKK